MKCDRCDTTMKLHRVKEKKEKNDYDYMYICPKCGCYKVGWGEPYRKKNVK